MIVVHFVFIFGFFRMQESRYLSAGAFNEKNGFIITGGNNGNINTEYIHERNQTLLFTKFTPLPVSVRDHCLVSLDNGYGDFFLTGGVARNRFSTKSFIFKSRLQQWAAVADMPLPRRGKCTPIWLLYKKF